MPANLASVFLPMNNLETDLQTNLISPNEINYSEGNSDEEDPESQKGPELKRSRIVVVKHASAADEEDEESPQSYVKNFGKAVAATAQPNSILKASRYFSYRSSLTNSVRGSLMECTVPEDGVTNDLDTNHLDSASVNFSKPRRNRAASGNRQGANR